MTVSLDEQAHPDWCLGGADCAAGWHSSRIHLVVPHGGEVVHVGVGLWQVEAGPLRPVGVLLELSSDEEIEQWPIELAQARALVAVLQGLLRIADAAPPGRP